MWGKECISISRGHTIGETRILETFRLLHSFKREYRKRESCDISNDITRHDMCGIKSRSCDSQKRIASPIRFYFGIPVRSVKTRITSTPMQSCELFGICFEYCCVRLSRIDIIACIRLNPYRLTIVTLRSGKSSSNRTLFRTSNRRSLFSEKVPIIGF